MHLRDHLDAEHPALVLYPSGLTLSFRELENAANQLAHYFRDAGLRAGDTVAVIMENSPHFIVAMWAARRSGLYYVLVNTHLTPAEAAYILDDSDVSAVFASARMRDLALGAVSLLTRATPTIRLLADADSNTRAEGWTPYPDCVDGLPTTPIADETEGDLLQYSSGTTGRPKGIRRELRHVRPEQAPIGLAPLLAMLGVTAGSVYLSPAPLYHTAPAFWSISVQALGAT